MPKKKNIKKTATIIVIVLIILAASLRIMAINQHYPPPTINKVGGNEPLFFSGFEFSLESIKMYTDRELAENFDIQAIPQNETYYDKKTLVFELHIIRVAENVPQNMDIRFVSSESEAWTNGSEPAVFERINIESGNLSDNEIGQTHTYYVPVELYDVQFSEENWKKIRDREFSLVLSVYPEKTELSGKISEI